MIIEVTEDQFEYALCVLPPFFCSPLAVPDGLGDAKQLIQVSEPCDYVNGKATYATYAWVQKDDEDKYYYLGEQHRIPDNIDIQAENIRLMAM